MTVLKNIDITARNDNDMIVLGNFSKIGTFVVCIFEFYLGQQIVVIAPTVLEKYANAFGPRCVSWLQLLQRAKLITITRALG